MKTSTLINLKLRALDSIVTNKYSYAKAVDKFNSEIIRQKLSQESLVLIKRLFDKPLEYKLYGPKNNYTITLILDIKVSSFDTYVPVVTILNTHNTVTEFLLAECIVEELLSNILKSIDDKLKEKSQNP